MAFETLTIDINARLAKFETELRKVGGAVQKSARDTERAYKQSLDRLEAHARKVGAALGGFFGGRMFVQFINSATEAQDRMDELAQKAGIPIEKFSSLKLAGDVAGVSLDQLSDGINKLNKSIAETAGDTGEARDAFRALGIEVKEAGGALKPTDEVLLAIAEKFARMEDGAGKVALAMRIFGRSGADLIPFLNQGREGIERLRQEAERLGIVIGKDAAKAASDFQDNLARLGAAAQGLGFQLANSLIPGLNNLLEQILEIKRIAPDLGSIFRSALEDIGDPSANIAKLRGEIQRIQAAAAAPGAGLAQIKDLERVESLEKRIALARVRERQAERNQPPLEPLNFGRIDTGLKEKAPILGDPGEGKKREDALARAAEQRAKQVLEIEQRFAALRLKTLEGAYSQGLIGEETYWQARRSIQQVALDAEVQAIDAEIEIRRKAVSGAKAGTADRVNAERELAEAIARRGKVEQEFAITQFDDTLAAARATREYADAVSELNARLAELEGRSADALRIRQEQQGRTLRARFAANDDTASLSRLDTVEAGARAQATINDLRARGAEITDRLAIAEERVQNSLRTGSISEIEALRRTGDERVRALEQLQKLADTLQKTADESGLDRLKIQAEQFRVEVDRLAAQSDLLKDKFDSIADSALADFLAEAANDFRNVEDAAKRMFDTITREITKLAAQDLSKSILGGLGGNSFGSIFAKLFRGAGTNSSSVAAFLDAIGGQGFANGGSFLVGGTGGVDQTPVMFRATRGERVTISPPGQTAGTGVTNVVHMNFSGSPADRRSIGQAANEIGRTIGRWTRRNS